MNRLAILITHNSTEVRKSKSEIARLNQNALAQNILMQKHVSIKTGQKTQTQVGKKGLDIHEPEGEIDYTRFNKSKTKK